MDPVGEIGPRDNKGIEAMTFSADGETIWFAMEASLYQDGDLSTIAQGSVARFTNIDRDGNVIGMAVHAMGIEGDHHVRAKPLCLLQRLLARRGLPHDHQHTAAPDPGSRGQGLDGLGRAAPAAGDLLDRLAEDVFVLDGQLTPEGEVVDRPRPAGDGDVETGQVAAGGAAVADEGHGMSL